MFAALACDNRRSLTPVGPSDPGFSDPAIAQNVRQQWSPYVGVHATGEALAAYQDSLALLLRSGRLRGVRVEITKSRLGSGDRVIRTIGAMGIELLGLINNELLFDADIEGVLDRIFSTYPEIRYFQVGNEITTILPPSGPTMTIERYMEVFQRAYDHVQLRYPVKSDPADAVDARVGSARSTRAGADGQAGPRTDGPRQGHYRDQRLRSS